MIMNREKSNFSRMLFDNRHIEQAVGRRNLTILSSSFDKNERWEIGR